VIVSAASGSAVVSAASVGTFASFFMAVKGDRRMAADMKIALYGTEFSRESNAVNARLAA
jgi:hypothetical protein